jgi:hypothetical protein
MQVDPPADRDDIFLSPVEVANRHGKTVQTLANERHLGEGLPWTKLGGKVAYRLADVLAYETAGRRGLTWSWLREAMRSFRDLPPPIADKLHKHLREQFERDYP